MSRIGKKPISIPSAVKVEVAGDKVSVSGPKGKLERRFPASVAVSLDTARKLVKVDRTAEDKQARTMHGTARALIQNMVTGCNDGYSRSLEVYGTGYNVKVEGKNIVLNVGYAHTVALPIPTGVTVNVEVPQTKGNETPAKFSVSGPDKQVLGQFVRSIRDCRPPEPYQGKGIRFAGEQIKRKQGKAFAGGSGGA